MDIDDGFPDDAEVVEFGTCDEVSDDYVPVDAGDENGVGACCCGDHCEESLVALWAEVLDESRVAAPPLPSYQPGMHFWLDDVEYVITDERVQRFPHRELFPDEIAYVAQRVDQ